MSPRCFSWEGALIAACVLLAASAAWLTANRQQGYAIAFTSHADLYQLADMPRIGALRDLGGMRLQLELENLPDRAFDVRRDDGAPRRVEGRAPVLELAAGRHEYALRGEQSGRELSLAVEAGKQVERPLVTMATLPMGARSPHSIGDFTVDAAALPAAGRAEAQKLLDAAGVRPKQPAIEKVQRIAAYLHGQLEPHRGPPSPRMRALDGYAQYREAMAGRSGVHCSNHAEIYAYVAAAAGLPTRVIDIAGREGDVELGAHTFNESYLAEQNQWAYVDLQLGTAAVRGPDGGFLSGADILQQNLSRTAGEDLVAYQLEGSRAVEGSYAGRKALVEMFVPGTGTLIYHWGELERFTLGARLWRLFLRPEPSYSLVASGTRVPLRLWLTYLALLAMAAWVLLRLRHHSGRCGCAADAA